MGRDLRVIVFAAAPFNQVVFLFLEVIASNRKFGNELWPHSDPGIMVQPSPSSR